MTKYIYKGPPSGVTLADNTEKLLHPDAEVDLDPEHPYTKTLLALNPPHLVLAPEAPKGKAAKDTPKGGEA